MNDWIQDMKVYMPLVEVMLRDLDERMQAEADRLGCAIWFGMKIYRPKTKKANKIKKNVPKEKVMLGIEAHTKTCVPLEQEDEATNNSFPVGMNYQEFTKANRAAKLQRGQ